MVDGKTAATGFGRILTRGFCLVAIVAIGVYGRQWKVVDVRFTGNHLFSRSSLLGNIETKPPHFWEFKKKVTFSFSKLNADLLTVKTLYAQSGYFDAVAVAKPAFDSAASQVSIEIAITEGAQTVVDTVLIAGKCSIGTDAVKAQLTTRVGEPLYRRTIGKDVQLITDKLGMAGRLYARVKSSVEIDSVEHRASVTYSIDEGPVVFAGQVKIIGLRTMHAFVPARELRFTTGDTLKLGTIRRSLQRLYATGLFSYVQIEPAPDTRSDSGRMQDSVIVPVSVLLSEAHFLSIDGSVGYGSYEHFRASIQTRYGNCFARGHALSFNGNYNRWVQRGTIAYSFPWFFSLPWQADITPFVEHDNLNYLGLFDGVTLTLSQEFDWNLLYRVWATVERAEYVHQLRTDTNYVGSYTNSQIIGGDIVYDSRIHRADTSRGVYVELSPQLAGLGGHGTNQYYRTLLDLRGYLNPSKTLSLSSAINIGFSQGYGTNGVEVPLQALYYIGSGGMRQLRGYSVNDTTLKGGRFAVVINLFDIQLQMHKWFGVTVFSDAGATWSSPDNAKLNGLRWVVGPGFFIKSPIGQVQFDWGYLLNYHPGWGNLYFTVGKAF
jgi:outer membrane protein assembly complex protein YaeT